MKLLKKYSLLLVLLGGFAEFTGLIYGIRPSDVIYHHLFFQRDIENNKEIYSLFENDIEAGVHKDVIEWSASKNKYSQSIFFSSLLGEIRKNNISENFILENVRRIYYVDKLFFTRLPAGGTYNVDEKAIYITAKRRDGVTYFSKRMIVEAFHHELSSILIKKYNFDEGLWRSTFDNDFAYKIDEDPFYFAIYMQGDADKIDSVELYSRGLLEQYAETGFENDFNIYAEFIFTEPLKLRKLISQYPVINRKYKVIKEFYISINKEFLPVFERIDN